MEIIKNKPIPPKRDQQQKRQSKWNISEQMEVGDCIIVATNKEVSLLNNRFRRAGKKSVSRKLSDGTIGVWRTE